MAELFNDSFTVVEQTTPIYSGTLRDQAGAVVGSGATNIAFTLTLKDIDTGTVINTRNAQNILNTNDVTLDTNGVFAWKLRVLDTTLHSSTLEENRVERRIAIFEWSWDDADGDSQAGKWVVLINLKNLEFIT